MISLISTTNRSAQMILWISRSVLLLSFVVLVVPKEAFALNQSSNANFTGNSTYWTATNSSGTDTCGSNTSTTETSFETFAFSSGTTANGGVFLAELNTSSNKVHRRGNISQQITVPGSGNQNVRGRFTFSANGVSWNAVGSWIRMDLYDTTNATYQGTLGCQSFTADVATTTLNFATSTVAAGNYAVRITFKIQNAPTNGADDIYVDNVIVTTPPVGLAATAPSATTNAKLDWTVSTATSTAPSIHGSTPYKVYRSTSSGAEAFLGNATSNTYTDTTTTGNTTYYYWVTNLDTDSIESASSTEVSLLTLPGVPGTPTFSSITQTTLTASWSAPTGGATTYKVERCQGSGCSSFSQIASGVAGTSYPDSGLTAGTTYRYRVRATNATGDGDYSASSADVTTSAATGSSGPAQTATTTIKGGTSTGLVGWWKFDESEGTRVQDSSGNGNHGSTVNMATPPTATSGRTGNGKFGRALNFDGSNDFVRVTGGPTLNNLANKVTVSAWVKRINGAGFPRIVNKKNSISDTSGFDISLSSGGNVHVYSSNSSGYGPVACETNVTNPPWTHIVVIFNGTYSAVYCNGVFKGQGSITPVATTSYPLEIGRIASEANNMKGAIDDVRVYGKVLSDDEIRNLYKAGAVKMTVASTLGLVGWWKFDEATGTIAQDSSGRNNRGTLSNFANPPTSISGRTTKGMLGRALNFDQSDDIVQIPASTSTDLRTNRFTLSAWVKPTVLANQAFVVGKSAPACSDYFQAWALQLGGNITANQTITFSLTTGGSRTQMDADTGRSFLGVWSHVVATWDGSTMRVYKNGVSQGTPTAKSGNIQTSSEPVRIGTGVCGVALEGLKGTIDDVRIYNRALGADEIQALYKSGSVRIKQ